MARKWYLVDLLGAREAMHAPLTWWVHYPSDGKAKLFEAYEAMAPKQRAAWDDDVRAAFAAEHGGLVAPFYRRASVLRASAMSASTRGIGGASLSAEEPAAPHTAWLVHADDVLAHWAQPGSPLGGRAFGHEREIILKPGAAPDRLHEIER